MLIKVLLSPFKALFHIFSILVQSFLSLFKFSFPLFFGFFKFSAVLFLIAFFFYATVFFPGKPKSRQSDVPEKTKDEKCSDIVTKTSKSMNQNNYYYRSYRFSDLKNENYTLKYAILKKNVQKSENVFGFSKKELRNAYYQTTSNFNRKYRDKINIKMNKDLSYEIEYKSDYAFLAKQFEQFLRHTKKIFYTKHMITVSNHNIYPDYRAIQKWQEAYLKRLYDKLKCLALNNHMTEREMIILIARFVQHMKYKIPVNRGNKNILGFWPPLICLKEKAGDCDSKSTLFASIFYHYRKKSCVLILTKQHAFIGIKNQHKLFPKDRVLKIKGIDYILIETTSLQKIGSMTKDVMVQLKKRQFNYIGFY